MDERRPLMPSPLWDYQWEKRISTFSAPPRHDVLGETNGGICLSQLMQQLDELNLRGEEPTSKFKDTVEKCVNLGQKYSKIFLPTLNSKCNLSTGSAICCSPLEPTLLQGQLQRHQPDLKCYKALRSWSHHPKRKYLLTPRNNQGDNSGVAQSEIPLRITPAVVTHNHGLRDRRAEGQGTRNVVSSPYCLAPNRFEGPGAETSNSSSTGQSSHSSLFMDFPSDDSDLSDQERTSMSDHERTTVSAQDWATPVELELELRPEPFDKDDPKDYSESREDRLPYPEVLPAPLKILDLTQNLFNRADWERRQSFIRQDPSLFVLANRLVEMERMQAATVQRERAKVGWSRSATAIGMTRSTARIRKADLLGSQPESLVPGMEPGGECPSVLHGIADLTLPHTPVARRRLKTACVPSRQSHDTRGSTVNCPTLPKQPHSSSSRPSKTSCLSSGPSVQGFLLNAVPSSYKVERLRGSKKVTSRLKRKSSSTRKRNARPDRKL
ncbi:uncharacterized protein LOC118232732 [Anguilla anguilla]|uniref:uncharacterized protein LOC118232732 n=1 Tax=Anguilla anguilla TaxID=7936 RepID=UPI0015ABDE62|nr:uncharacterized protein LOC118232732 [Anguilla anguilla]